jgi:hypothetical protein
LHLVELALLGALVQQMHCASSLAWTSKITMVK